MNVNINNSTDVAVTFNGIPTVVECIGNNTKTTKEYTYIGMNGSKILDGTESMSLNGVMFTFTNNLDDARNNIIYVAESNTSSTQRLMCYSLFNALNNSTLASDYDIYMDIPNLRVYLYCKNLYTEYPTYTHNGVSFYVRQSQQTSGSSELFGNELMLTLYNDSSYVTTLQKQSFSDDVMFDVSPILQSVTDFGKASKYSFIIYLKTSYDLNTAYNSSTIYGINGYSVNNGLRYLRNSDLKNGKYLLQNVSQGSPTTVYNNTALWVYEPNITFSIFSNSSKTQSITTNYLNSLFQTVNSSSTSKSLAEGITDVSLALNNTYMNNSSYVDVILADIGTLRFNIQKPLLYTSTNNRVYFRNSYGGLSFFDFNGGYEKQVDIDTNTYMSNSIYLYKNNEKSILKSYNKENETEVSLTSNILTKDSLYIFYDMAESNHCYIMENGNKYEIIIDSLDIAETEGMNDAYTVTLTYTYQTNTRY